MINCFVLDFYRKTERRIELDLICKMRSSQKTSDGCEHRLTFLALGTKENLNQNT